MGTTPALELNGLTLDELETFAEQLGAPRYRGRQIAHWIYQRGAASFAEMTDLPAALRARLAETARITALIPLTSVTADGGDTAKHLLQLVDGVTVETVVMRYHDGRRSICVSTQVGCAMGCTFCATGMAGLTRNLTAAEIVAQVILAQRHSGDRMTNVVFMGMGEPLANYDATLRAVRLLNAPYGLGIGMRHLTVSTVGLVPQIRKLASERLQLTLAISLHAPTDELRDRLVPVNRRWPVAELLDAGADYVRQTGRRVSFEYVLMEEVNDSPLLAATLGELLRARSEGVAAADGQAEDGIPVGISDHGSEGTSRRAPLPFHVNLIPWNPVFGMQYRRPARERVEAFARELRRRGLGTTVRSERGVEIDAACGQLQRTHGVTAAGPSSAEAASSGRARSEEAWQGRSRTKVGKGKPRA